jgi:Ser/Thr protein kinase RdoA (MazF antagonist)
LWLNLGRHLQTCCRIGAVDSEEARQIEAAFAAHRSLLNDIEPALLHGDLGNHNIFAADDTVSAIIDWEDCLAGDPIFDVAFWATFHPPRRHAAFLAGYKAVNKLPHDFEARFWLYFLRIALSKTVLRHRLGLKDHPDRPKASLRIQQGLHGLLASRRIAA